MVLQTSRRGRPLSIGQEALWFLHRLAPDSGAYNVVAATSLHFPVHVDALATAVRATVARHDVLHAVFRTVGGETRRQDVASDRVPFEVRDVSAMDDDELRRTAMELGRRPFRLDRETPIRFDLLRRTGRPDILLVAAHHIAVDDISQVLIFREVLDNYAGIAGGDPEAEFDDLVARQRELVDSEWGAAARTYWQGELAGAKDLGLPTDFPRPDVRDDAGAEVDVPMTGELLMAVSATAAASSATPFAFLLTVFQLLLYSVSGHEEMVIGYPVTLRSARRYRGAVGYFVNTLPLCVRLDPDDTFPQALRRTGEKLRRGLVHREYPFALLPGLAGGRRELFSTMFTLSTSGARDPFFDSVLAGHRLDWHGLTVSRFDVPQQQGQFDLTIQVLRHGDAAQAKLKYHTSLFTERTAHELARRYVELLAAAAGGQLPPRLRELARRHLGEGMA